MASRIYDMNNDEDRLAIKQYFLSHRDDGQMVAKFGDTLGLHEATIIDGVLHLGAAAYSRLNELHLISKMSQAGLEAKGMDADVAGTAMHTIHGVMELAGKMVPMAAAWSVDDGLLVSVNDLKSALGKVEQIAPCDVHQLSTTGEHYFTLASALLTWPSQAERIQLIFRTIQEARDSRTELN